MVRKKRGQTLTKEEISYAVHILQNAKLHSLPNGSFIVLSDGTLIGHENFKEWALAIIKEIEETIPLE